MRNRSTIASQSADQQNAEHLQPLSGLRLLAQSGLSQFRAIGKTTTDPSVAELCDRAVELRTMLIQDIERIEPARQQETAAEVDSASVVDDFSQESQAGKQQSEAALLQTLALRDLLQSLFDNHPAARVRRLVKGYYPMALKELDMMHRFTTQQSAA